MEKMKKDRVEAENVPRQALWIIERNGKMNELDERNHDKNDMKRYPKTSYPGNRAIEAERYRKFGERIPGDPMFGERLNEVR